MAKTARSAAISRAGEHARDDADRSIVRDSAEHRAGEGARQHLPFDRHVDDARTLAHDASERTQNERHCKENCLADQATGAEEVEVGCTVGPVTDQHRKAKTTATMLSATTHFIARREKSRLMRQNPAAAMATPTHEREDPSGHDEIRHLVLGAGRRQPEMRIVAGFRAEAECERTQHAYDDQH